MTESGDRSSLARKRALRILMREQYADYSLLYEEIRPATQTRHQARGRAWTQLRARFPDRYLELYAQEQAGLRTQVPAGIRSKSWQRALVRLADLRDPAYRKLFAQFRALGMNPPRAADRALAALREANSDLFARLLTEEYQLWLAATATGPPGRSAQDGSEPNGPALSGSPGPESASSSGALAHPLRVDRSPPVRHWASCRA
jgi:hypothetical protein